MDFCFINTENRWERFNRIADVAQENNTSLVINWHQRVFNIKEFPVYLKSYINIIEECKRRNAKFYTLGEFYDNMKF